MWLRSINVFYDYLDDFEKTKERTRSLRIDSDFLDYLFRKKIKYINNNYLRKLNICCSPSVKNICISSLLSEGYPVVSVPFDYDRYTEMNDDEKTVYWIDLIEKVFIFLEPEMNCEDEKIERYIRCLRESDMEEVKEKVRKSYEAWEKQH